MIKSSNKFKHENPFTIGVEEEYMLCHPKRGSLINRAEEIIKSIPPELKSRYSYELILSEIEVNTKICDSVAEAVREIGQLRTNTKTIGNEIGFLLGIQTIIEKFINPGIPIGYPTIIIIIAIFSGIQLIAIGMIGEYLGRIFLSQNKKPQYSIRKIFK